MQYDIKTCHTEWSKSDRGQICDITYMWNLKKDTDELIYKTEIELQMWKTYGYQGTRERRSKLEIKIDVYIPVYIKWITDKDLLYSTRNSTQYSVMAYMGKES